MGEYMSAGGRPSLYEPAYCEQVIEWGKLGKSKAWMCANLNVSRQTVEDWAKAHPEFLDAITHAMLLSQAWWEDLGQENIVAAPGQGSLNGAVYSRSMAARFPADWREKTEQKIEGKMEISGITRRILDSNPDGTGS